LHVHLCQCVVFAGCAHTCWQSLCLSSVPVYVSVISNLTLQSFYNILLLFYAKSAASNFLIAPSASFMAPRSARILLQFTIYVSAAIITETS